VIGQRGPEIAREIERFDSDFDVEIEYVQQEKALGIAHCVGCLESKLEGPFFLFLGDIYFHAPEMGRFVEEFRKPGVDAVLGAIEEEDPALVSRNFCISIDDDGRATQVIEKPRFPRSLIKGVGLYLFSPAIFDAVRRTPRTALRNEYELTDSIQILIDYGYHVRLCGAVERDFNITYPRDLLTANMWLLEHNKLSNAVAPGATVGENVELRNAVVGPGATIGDGASLTNCVVFAGCKVPAEQSLAETIVTDQGILGA